MHHEPATSIIAKFGGIREVASIVDVNVHSVTKWRLSKDKGGTGGSVPHWHVPKLVDAATRRGIELSHADFFSPTTVAASSSDSGENGARAVSSPVPNSEPLAQGAGR